MYNGCFLHFGESSESPRMSISVIRSKEELLFLGPKDYGPLVSTWKFLFLLGFIYVVSSHDGTLVFARIVGDPCVLGEADSD